MKKIILVLLITIGPLTKVQSQEKTKDTLYFAVDKYYTISPTITPNISDQKYAEWHKATEEQMKYVSTNGYIYFIGNGFLTTGLKPKKLLSIKDFIENRSFYLDGKYNNIVDNYKIQDSLIDKYTVFFVNGNEFIQPRYLEYKSFYTRRNNKGDFIANPLTKRDTLYFDLDNEYVYPSKYNKNDILINASKCSGGGAFYFEVKELIDVDKPIQLLDLKKYIHSSRFYYSKEKELSCYELTLFINSYVIIFVRKNKDKLEFLRAQAQFVIED